MTLTIAVIVLVFALFGTFFIFLGIARNRAVASETPENRLLMEEYAEAKARYYDVVFTGVSSEGIYVPMQFSPYLRDRALELYGPKCEIKERCLKAGIPEWKLKIL